MPREQAHRTEETSRREGMLLEQDWVLGLGTENGHVLTPGTKAPGPGTKAPSCPLR